MHCRLTGVSPKPILNNLNLLLDIGLPVIIRAPLIHGVNDTKEHLEFLAELSRYPGVRELNIMPYHRYGSDKWTSLGFEYTLTNLPDTSPMQVETWKTEVIKQDGVNIIPS